MVKEIYVRDGILENTKYVLMIDDEGKPSLTFYINSVKIEQYKPILIKFMRGIRIEYGVENDEGVRTHMQLIDYDTGELHEKWEKIK